VVGEARFEDAGDLREGDLHVAVRRDVLDIAQLTSDPAVAGTPQVEFQARGLPVGEPGSRLDVGVEAGGSASRRRDAVLGPERLQPRLRLLLG
jgi:hypothetical protein